jgi:NitT/TauT family transport system permease protein
VEITGESVGQIKVHGQQRGWSERLTRQSEFLWAAGGTISFLMFWEAFVRIFKVRPILLPGPYQIIETIIERWPLLLENLIPTLIQVVEGFLVSVLAGSLVGIGVAHWRFFRISIYPQIIAFQVVPKVAVAPLFIVWFGTGDLSRIALAFFIAFFPIAVNTATGLAEVDPEMVRMSRAFGGNGWQIFKKVEVPSALPIMFSGYKIGITLAVIGIIVAEFVTAGKGIGYLVLFSQGMLDTPLMMAAIVMLSIAGSVLYYAVRLTEYFVIYWKRERSF